MLCRPVQDAEAALTATAAAVMRQMASNPRPTFDSIARAFDAGIPAADKHMPQHVIDAYEVVCISLLQSTCEVHSGLLQMIMKPMQLVDWEPSQLPPELQDCKDWMPLSLGIL